MQCPVCNLSLSKIEDEATLHVNQCLDGASVSSLPSSFPKSNDACQTSIKNFFKYQEPNSVRIYEDRVNNSTPRRTFLPSLPLITGSGSGPAHKRILGLPTVAVDAFGYGPLEKVEFYFLSHFHSDHYRGLDKNFNWGTILCSEVTANLVCLVLGVDERYIRRLPLDQWIKVGDFGVFLMDAFHCPGSVMFIFHRPDNRFILHTGDFRASSTLINNPQWHELKNLCYEAIYLDTTYADPKYIFPPQDKIIDDCCRLVDRLVNRNDQRLFSPIRRLILVGSYLIGKEKVALAIAQLLDTKIYCDMRKQNILTCMNWPELEERLTLDATQAQLHIVSMSDLTVESISTMLNCLWPHFTHALAIKPTGWTCGRNSSLTFADHVRRDMNEQTVKRKDAIAILSTPYSEHSSYDELRNFLSTPKLTYQWVIPTVDNNGDFYLKRGEFSSAEELLQAWHMARQLDRNQNNKNG